MVRLGCIQLLYSSTLMGMGRAMRNLLTHCSVTYWHLHHSGIEPAQHDVADSSIHFRHIVEVKMGAVYQTHHYHKWKVADIANGCTGSQQ